jgi:hypothetical protein
MASTKKRRTNMDAVSIHSIIDPGNNVWSIGVGMYGKIYVAYHHPAISHPTMDSCVKRFNPDGTCEKYFLLTDKDGSTIDREYFPVSIGIDTIDGINKEALIEASKIPELYIFPPGVLPICISYLGDDAIYVSLITTHGERLNIIYDTNGKHIGCVGKEITWRSCISDGLIHSIYNHRVHIHTLGGMLLNEWITPADITGGDIIRISDRILITSRSTVCCYDSTGVFIRRFEVTKPHGYRVIFCGYNDTLMVCSCDMSSPYMLRCIGQYNINGELVKSLIVDHLNITNIETVVSAKGDAHLYALQEHTTSKIYVISF